MARRDVGERIASGPWPLSRRYTPELAPSLDLPSNRGHQSQPGIACQLRSRAVRHAVLGPYEFLRNDSDVASSRTNVRLSLMRGGRDLILDRVLRPRWVHVSNGECL